MVIRRAAVVLAVPALMGVFAGSAAAEPPPVAGQGELSPASPADFSNCPATFACYYTGLNGTGQQCSWWGDSADHRFECSWAADTNVRSIFAGVNPAFAGLCSYSLPNYDTSGRVVWQEQGTGGVGLPDGGWKVLSHRWVTGVGPGAC